jgi:transcription factor STE12
MDASSSSSHIHYISHPTYPHYPQQSSAIPSSALFAPDNFVNTPHYRPHLPTEPTQAPDMPMTTMTPAPLDDEEQDLVLLSNISDLPSSSMQGFQNNHEGDGLSRPLTHQEQERLANLDRLKFFLATAPSAWSGCTTIPDMSAEHPTHPNAAHPALNRFLLPNQEYVTCVLWNGLYHITGTDIVRALVFRFEAFGRPVKNMKKFEEGVFSDLRNLKPGVDASLEEPKVCASPVPQLSGPNAFLSVVSFPGSFVQVSVHTHTEEAKGLLLVRPFYHLFSCRLINSFLGTLFLMTGSSLMPLSAI